MNDPARRKRILKKMEHNLSKAISHNDSKDKISNAVHKIRESKLSYFKGQKEISRFEEENENRKLYENIQKHLENIEKNIKLWKSLTDNEIIKLYADKSA